MKVIAKTLFCLTLLAMMVCSISAQNAAKNWVFGNHAWLDFNLGAPATPGLPPSSTFATAGGSSSISDSNGTLLFYTNGVSVWNRDHNIMPHGTGLHGSTTSTQSALIVPCTCNKYFIFTTDTAPYTRGLKYSVVDMTADVGMGDITPLKNIQLIAPAAEKIAAVKDGNGGFWVIAHDVRTNPTIQGNRFFAYHLLPGADCNVNPTPVISAAGSTYTYASLAENKYSPGQMKISPDGKLLAVAGFDNVASSNTSFIELFKFNATTGLVSGFDGFLVPKVTMAKKAYGIEFSPNSRYLYAGTRVTTSNNLYRFDTIGNTLSSDWTYNFGNNRQIPGSFQLAPDGKIYIAVNGLPLLRFIDNPDDPFPASNINVGTFTLASGSASTHGLPAMVAGDFACINTGLPGGGCACDQVTQTPFWTPDLSLAWKAFNIYNVKSPGSNIRSVDIDISDSNGQPPPQSPWAGGGLRVNGTMLQVPDWWRSPYTRIPNGTIYNKAIAARSNYSLPAVSFNLGLDYSADFTGTVKLKFTHDDGSICQWTSDNWTPGPPTQLMMRISERYLGDLKSEFLPLALGFSGDINIKSNAKWIAVEPLDADTEVFSLDGGEIENENTTDRRQLVIGSAKKQNKAALYELVQPVDLEGLAGGEVKLVLKRPAGNSTKPRLRFIFFDENANIIGFATNEDSK